MSESTYIMEFSQREISLMATLVHAFLIRVPEHDDANLLLTSLIQQAHHVSRDPLDHGGASKLMSKDIRVDNFQTALEGLTPEILEEANG